MVQEFLDIIDEQGSIVGKEERKVAHEKHLLHREAHLIIANSHDEILLQLRTTSKEQYPGFWCSSASGHVLSGENPQQAMKREMNEEIGLDVLADFVGEFRVDDSEENEIVSLFFAKIAESFDFALQEEEVQEVKFYKVSYLKENLGSLKLTTAGREALRIILEKFY